MPYNSALDKNAIRKTPLAAPSKNSSFGEAFKSARAAGKKTFTYNGKAYTTQTKEEASKKSSAKSEPKNQRPASAKLSKSDAKAPASMATGGAAQTARIKATNAGIRASIEAGKARRQALIDKAKK